MLAPNPSSSHNGRPSFVNPKYLKKAQSEKLCLYKIPYGKDDLVNIFAPNCKETLILEEESRSKILKEDDILIEKQEIFEDLEYVQSLEKEVDELEFKKAEFSNEYDLLLQECLSKYIMCVILRSFENIDEQTEL
ncbi:hypothetical protein Tco_0322093 [Tanacetum coccineum]